MKDFQCFKKWLFSADRQTQSVQPEKHWLWALIISWNQWWSRKNYSTIIQPTAIMVTISMVDICFILFFSSVTTRNSFNVVSCCLAAWLRWPWRRSCTRTSAASLSALPSARCLCWRTATMRTKISMTVSSVSTARSLMGLRWCPVSTEPSGPCTQGPGYRDSHHKAETVVRPPQLYNGNPYT